VQRPTLEPRHISTAFVASTTLGLLVAAVVWLSAPLIADFYRMPQLTEIVRALAILFPVAGITTVAENLIQRDFRFRLLANTDVVTYAIGYGLVAIVLGILGWGVWALVVGQLMQSLLRATILLWAAPPKLRTWPTWDAFRELAHYGAGQTMAGFAWLLANQADYLVVGRWLGAVALGLYSRAYQLMAVPTMLLGDVLDKVLFPTMARVQHDVQRLASVYLQGLALVALVALPAGVVAAVLAPELVEVASGRGWEGAIMPFQVLAMAMMVRTSHRLSDSLARATGRVYRRAWRDALYAVLVFAGALAGRSYGITGVAAGVFGALVFNYLLMAHLSLSVGQISWLQFARVQLPAIGPALVLGAVALATVTGMRQLGSPALVSLVAALTTTAVAAVLLVRLAPPAMFGVHGVRMGQTLRSYLMTRLRRTA